MKRSKTVVQITLAIVALLILSACGGAGGEAAGDLANTAGGAPSVESCRAEPGELSAECQEFMADVFAQGDYQAVFDYRACLDEVIALESPYCQFLTGLGVQYGVTVEECRGVVGGESHPTCDTFTNISFEMGKWEVITDYRACIDEVLALEGQYCQYLVNLADEYSVSIEECRGQIGNEPPNFACLTFVERSFEIGNRESEIKKDYQACLDEVLDREGPYCQFLFELADKYFEG